MTRIRPLFKSVLAAALLLSPLPATAQDGPPPPPQGDNQPTPQQVVEHCVRRLADLTGNTLEVMRSTTQRAVGLIAELDANGAPPPAILRVGAAGKGRVERALRFGTGAINAEAERCLRLLRELGAPPEAAGRILEARQRSLNALREGAMRSIGAIMNAVRTAVEGGDAPADQDATRSEAA